jgi:hypothetical protein
MNDPRDGAVTSGATHLQLQRRLEVEGTGGQGAARHGLHGHRFTGESGEIDR